MSFTSWVERARDVQKDSVYVPFKSITRPVGDMVDCISRGEVFHETELSLGHVLVRLITDSAHNYVLMPLKSPGVS